MIRSALPLCVLSLGSLLLVTAISVSASATPTQLPGNPVSISELDGLRGLGCGQFCSTTGNSQCTAAAGAAICVPTGATGPCRNRGANCGACTGGKHIKCQGSDPGSRTLCATYLASCCSGSHTCTSGVGCTCIGAAAPGTHGLRSLCRMFPNACGG